MKKGLGKFFPVNNVLANRRQQILTRGETRRADAQECYRIQLIPKAGGMGQRHQGLQEQDRGTGTGLR